jgi:hypothetical protein
LSSGEILLQPAEFGHILETSSGLRSKREYRDENTMFARFTRRSENELKNTVFLVL